MGESAGGNYVVALTARLKAKGKGLPYKIVGFSSFLAMLEEGGVLYLLYTHDLFHALKALKFEISDVSEAADVFKAVKDFIQ